MTPDLVDPALLGIVQRDYDAADKLARGSSQSADRTRTFGLTLIAAVVGVSVTTRTWALGATGAVLTFAVAVVDGYYSWQYATALEHLRRIELIEGLRFRALLPEARRSLGASAARARPETAAKFEGRLQARLQGFKPGAYGELKKFRLRELRFLQPYPVFRGLYPVVLIACLGAGLVAYLDRAEPTTVRLERSAGSIQLPRDRGWRHPCGPVDCPSPPEHP